MAASFVGVATGKRPPPGYVCEDDKNYLGDCIPGDDSCPLNSVTTLEACQAECSARRQCAALAHNKYDRAPDSEL